MISALVDTRATNKVPFLQCVGGTLSLTQSINQSFQWSQSSAIPLPSAAWKNFLTAVQLTSVFLFITICASFVKSLTGWLMIFG